MPSITFGQFKFYFTSGDHLPKHVHILKGKDVKKSNESAKIQLNNGRVFYSTLKSRDLKNVLKIISENKESLEGMWDEENN